MKLNVPPVPNQQQPTGFFLRGTEWRFALISFAFLCVLATFSGSGSCQVFKIEKIEAPSFSPKAINNRGVVVSEPTFIDNRWRIRLFERGVLRELPLPEQSYGVFAYALNDEGWVAGASAPMRGPARATIFKDSGAEVVDEAIQREITHLGVHPDACSDSSWMFSQALALNNYGQIVGSYCAGSADEERAFIRSTSGTRDLGSLGGKQTRATAINNLGHIAGWSKTAGGTAHLFLDDGNGLHDLGSLGGESVRPVAMNDRDEIAGYGFTPTGGMHIFLFKNGALIDLGCPENGQCMAVGMNSNGHIVGSVTVDLEDGTKRDHTFLYANGRFQYLDALLSNGKGWSGMRPTGINDADKIVGVGSFEGMGTGFILQPIP